MNVRAFGIMFEYSCTNYFQLHKDNWGKKKINCQIIISIIGFDYLDAHRDCEQICIYIIIIVVCRQINIICTNTWMSN